MGWKKLLTTDGDHIVNEQGRQDHVSNTMPQPYYRFDGVDNKIVVTDASNISPTPHMSEFVWIRFQDAGAVYGIASKWQGGSQSSWFFIRQLDKTLTVGISSDGSDSSGGRTDLSTTDTVANSVWVHVGFTVDSANLKIYINGVESASASHSNGIFDGTDDLDIGYGANNTLLM